METLTVCSQILGRRKLNGCIKERAHSHKEILPQRRGLRRVSESAEQQLNQLAKLALVMNIFLTPHGFVHQVDDKPSLFREGSRYPLASIGATFNCRLRGKQNIPQEERMAFSR
jgi:hypothetical protein